MANHFMSPPRSKVAVSSSQAEKRHKRTKKPHFWDSFFFLDQKCTIKVSKKGGMRQNEKGIIIGSSFHTVFENYSKKSHTNKYLNFGAKN